MSVESDGEYKVIIQLDFEFINCLFQENPTETKVHRFDTTLHGLGENRLEVRNSFLMKSYHFS